MIRAVVWNEFRQEKTDAPVRAVYPDGIHAAIAAHLAKVPGLDVSTAAQDEPGHGLPAERLERTDVLFWWGHRFQREVSDETVDLVCRRVDAGMGLVVLHSAHFSRPFLKLMGTTCRLGRWKEDGLSERVWTVNPAHPLAAGVGESFVVPRTEMYGEPFDVPPPDEQVFISWYESASAVFRSGCVWRRGRGKIFYFSPGHETYPIYRDPNVLRVLENAALHLGAPGVKMLK